MSELNNDCLDDGNIKIPGDKVLILKFLECKSTLASGGVCDKISLIVQADNLKQDWNFTMCAGDKKNLSVPSEQFEDSVRVEVEVLVELSPENTSKTSLGSRSLSQLSQSGYDSIAFTKIRPANYELTYRIELT
ncbi:MAG: hypothetical protein RM368_16170 [Nostoc sp. DedSLP03]|uniref:hypothetical protein n=1 Tax=Nostoc sp. DedSLP03 TaxID=3075400 RepID=UPI002AD56C66|nr:hypothetical protein [Nostoc sp. DedSLP03]MDZ7966488.1 hypothetical protein [Nostoc sp. DedSLP03]